MIAAFLYFLYACFYYACFLLCLFLLCLFLLCLFLLCLFFMMYDAYSPRRSAADSWRIWLRTLSRPASSSKAVQGPVLVLLVVVPFSTQTSPVWWMCVIDSCGEYCYANFCWYLWFSVLGTIIFILFSFGCLLLLDQTIRESAVGWQLK